MALHGIALVLAIVVLPITFAGPIAMSSGPVTNLTVQDASEPQCTDDFAFLTPSFNPEDCWRAIMRLINEYAWPDGMTRYEFIPPADWVRGDTGLHQQRTAQKWDSGSCVAAIVTLSAFEIGEFSFATWTTPVTDVGTYGQAAHWAELTARACMYSRLRPNPLVSEIDGTAQNMTGSRAMAEEMGGTAANSSSPVLSGSVATSKVKRWRERVGYTIYGEKRGLGIFIWAKGSEMDVRFDNHLPD